MVSTCIAFPSIEKISQNSKTMIRLYLIDQWWRKTVLDKKNIIAHFPSSIGCSKRNLFGIIVTTIVLDKYGVMRLHHEVFMMGKSLIYR
jgi:hypothetical protein